MTLALAALLAWPWHAALAELRALRPDRLEIGTGADPASGPSRADRAPRREGTGPALGLDLADDPDQDEAEPGVSPVGSAGWPAPHLWDAPGGPVTGDSPAWVARPKAPSFGHWFRC